MFLDITFQLMHGFKCMSRHVHIALIYIYIYSMVIGNGCESMGKLVLCLVLILVSV